MTHKRMHEEKLRALSYDATKFYLNKIGMMKHPDIAERELVSNAFYSGFYAAVRHIESNHDKIYGEQDASRTL